MTRLAARQPYEPPPTCAQLLWMPITRTFAGPHGGWARGVGRGAKSEPTHPRSSSPVHDPARRRRAISPAGLATALIGSPTDSRRATRRSNGRRGHHRRYFIGAGADAAPSGTVRLAAQVDPAELSFRRSISPCSSARQAPFAISRPLLPARLTPLRGFGVRAREGVVERLLRERWCSSAVERET